MLARGRRNGIEERDLAVRRAAALGEERDTCFVKPVAGVSGRRAAVSGLSRNASKSKNKGKRPEAHGGGAGGVWG